MKRNDRTTESTMTRTNDRTTDKSKAANQLSGHATRNVTSNAIKQHATEPEPRYVRMRIVERKTV